MLLSCCHQLLSKSLVEIVKDSSVERVTEGLVGQVEGSNALTNDAIPSGCFCQAKGRSDFHNPQDVLLV